MSFYVSSGFFAAGKNSARKLGAFRPAVLHKTCTEAYKRGGHLKAASEWSSAGKTASQSLPFGGMYGTGTSGQDS